MTRDAASFDRLYREKGDPWRYETSAYEADKYDRSLRLLSRARYARGLEIGCSIGVMSALIAARCERLQGLDFSPTAVARARARDMPNATFAVGAVPRDWPEGTWDLITFSEVLYYLNRAGLEQTIELAARSLAPAGDCLVVGYTGPTETEISAEEAGQLLLERLQQVWPAHAVTRAEGTHWRAAVFSRR